MELSPFNDFFSLLAGFNLAYAGWRQFRFLIINDILKVAGKKNPKITKLHDDIESLKTMKKFEGEEGGHLDISRLITSRTEAILQAHQSMVDSYKDKSLIAKEISEGFKSMFLYTGCYCLAFLIVAGYQSIIVQVNSFLFFLNLSISYNIFIFIRSFFSVRAKKIQPVIPVILSIGLLAGLPVILSRNDFEYPGKISINVAISVFISLSAYFLYFIRMNIHLNYYRKLFKQNDAECIKKLETFRNSIKEVFVPLS